MLRVGERLTRFTMIVYDIAWRRLADTVGICCLAAWNCLMSEVQRDDNPLLRLIEEAKRRFLFRAAGLYAGAAFVLLQLADVVLPGLGIDESAVSYLLIAIAAGFPAMLLVVWMIDLGGDRRQVPGRFMDAVIVVLALGVGWMYLERLVSDEVPVAAVDSASALDDEIVQSPLPEKVVLRNSIAVLPFENLSPDPDNAYFALGIHEEILNQLAKIEDLSVIARTSMLRYAETDKLIQDIAKELNVGAVMEGSVRYANNRVRVTAQLNDGVNGVHLWSETYDRNLDDIFSIQSDIALRITEAMKAEYSLDERQAIARQPTDNPEAFGHFVKGQALITGAEPDLIAGIRELEQAIALDPGYAEAYSMRAVMHGFLLQFWQPGVPLTLDSQNFNQQLAQQFADTALELDARQPLAHLAMSLVQEANREWDAAFESARRAHELQPSHSFISFVYGRWLLRRGQLDSALDIFHRTIALDPLNYNLPRFIGAALMDAGELEYAKQFLHQARAAEPDQAEPYIILSLVAVFENDLVSAATLMSQAELRTRDIEKSNFVTAFLYVYSEIGDRERLDAWIEFYREQQSKGALAPVQLAYGNAVLGDMPASIAQLRLMVSENFPVFPISVLHFHPDSPGWGPWADVPELQALIQEVARPLTGAQASSPR
jgi:TolB-like protein/Tfp pilus assembly protein PilF